MSLEFQPISSRPTNPDNNRLVVVTGISASGKDFLLRRLTDANAQMGVSIRVINFGELLFSRIRQASGLTSRDQLGEQLSQEVVASLVNETIDDVLNQQPAIINTHMAYKQQGGIQINPDIARRMAVNDYVFVWADPESIALRRTMDTSRNRQEEDTTDIQIHQQIALESTQVIAQALGAGFRSLDNRNDNVTENISKIQEVVVNL